MRRTLTLACSTTALLLAAVLAACTQDDPVHIGFVGGLTGRVADLGLEGRNGALLAVEQRNAEGGVNGRQVTLSIRDDAQDPSVVRSAVEELIALRVVAIIGPMTSSMSVAAVPLANRSGVPLVSPTATTRALSGSDDHFFRVIGATDIYAHKNARYQREVLGLRRIAAVYDLRNRAYSESWFTDFRAAFEAAGGEMAQPVTFSSGPEVHYTSLARQALASEPDGVLLIANSMDAALLAQQLRKLDPELPIAASEWAATERLIELGGQAVEGIRIAQFFDRDSPNPRYQAFRSAYVKRFGREPGFASVAAHDATNLVLAALAKGDGDQPLKQRLLAVGPFQGVQGPVRLDRFGDGHRETFLTTVRDHRFVSLERPRAQ